MSNHGSSLVKAKERSTGRLIGQQCLYLPDGYIGDATVSIPFDQDDFPSVRSSSDVELLLINLGGTAPPNGCVCTFYIY